MEKYIVRRNNKANLEYGTWDVKEGEYVLVHVGVAITKVDEKEAMQTLEYLKQMGEMDELDTSETKKKNSIG